MRPRPVGGAVPRSLATIKATQQAMRREAGPSAVKWRTPAGKALLGLPHYTCRGRAQSSGAALSVKKREQGRFGGQKGRRAPCRGEHEGSGGLLSHSPLKTKGDSPKAVPLWLLCSEARPQRLCPNALGSKHPLMLGYDIFRVV